MVTATPRQKKTKFRLAHIANIVNIRIYNIEILIALTSVVLAQRQIVAVFVQVKAYKYTVDSRYTELPVLGDFGSV